MTTILETTITAVTVYTDQALITRKGKVLLTGDEKELTISGLPWELKKESIRVAGAGSIGVKLGSVRVESVISTEPVVVQVAQLNQEITQIKGQLTEIENELATITQKKEFIQDLTQKSVHQFAYALSRKQVDLDETQHLLEFIEQRHTDYNHRTVELQNRQKDLEKYLKKLIEQIRQAATPQPNRSYNLMVTIFPEGAGDLELEVSYLIGRAQWVPLYDLHTFIEHNSLDLSYLAEITQNTGEDWQGVQLTLSTAKPGLGNLPPKISPWYIDLYHPENELKAKRVSRAYASETQNFSMRLSQNIDDELEEACRFEDDECQLFENSVSNAEPERISASSLTSQVFAQGGVVTFKIHGGGNIPSDGNPQTLTIFRDNYPCSFEFVAIPEMVSFAYLQALVTAENVTILPGKANLFRDNIFVGKTELPHVSPNQTFTLNLGIDERLQLDRTLVQRETDKRLFKDKRRLTIAYRTTITNLSDRPITLNLKEKLPVSRDEKLQVKSTKIVPTIPVGELGRLEWQLTIPGGAKKEVYYQFFVEHSPNDVLIGINI